ncbi:MAG: nickel-responsive transcriptional regulator NikR [Thermodesulfobacteriota bacterium]|nr:nickel-responsive transcriptional regulator NikR [Thermodesulfobacteriota bacterium]
MPDVIRFGVSLDKELLTKFDGFIHEKGYSNRSEAIRDLIREDLVRRQWSVGEEVAGAITIVYDHHKRGLVETLTEIQHDNLKMIISSQHVHLDHYNCLEALVVKGKPEEVEKLAENLKAVKGVKHSSLTMTTTGRELI